MRDLTCDISTSTGAITDVNVARRFLSRLVGLMREPAPSCLVNGGMRRPVSAMLFPHCPRVHMAFMRTEIDIAYLARRDVSTYEVIGLERGIPWRPTHPVSGCDCVLEASAGALFSLGALPGEIVLVTGIPEVIA